MAKAGRPRSTTAVDTHIGQKIRARRILLGLSQTELADAAGISFQQIQKYEKGTNRVGASRLQQFSDPRLERKHPRHRKVSYQKARSFHF
jgi:DNA-binding XRE family transcriptional regulator